MVSGTPTEAGTINLYIAGQRLTIGVTTADTASSIATAINAAINAAADLPVTSTVDTATVTIACRHKGLWGNDIDIRTNYRGSLGGEKTPAGVTLTITAMASGTTNPTLQTAIDAMPEEIYDFIVNPYTDSTNLSALKTELTLRWGPLVLLESHAFSAHRATVANLTTLGNSHNSQHLTIMGYNDSPTPPYEWAAAYAAVAAYYLTIDPARPLQTLDLKGVLAPPLTSRFLLSERNILLTDGIATFSVDRDGTVRIERAATTYQLNVASAPDPSYLDTETMATLAYLSQSFRTRMKLKFPRYKIADDGTRVGVGQALVTPRDIRDECIALFGLWEENGLVENVDQFKDDLVVERDGSDPNRVNILLPPDLVNQLRIIATQIQFRL